MFGGDYENMRRVVYGPPEQLLCFLPICPICCRFVKADKTIPLNVEGGYIPRSNALCSKHGRVEMPFEGYFCKEDFKNEPA